MGLIVAGNIRDVLLLISPRTVRSGWEGGPENLEKINFEGRDCSQVARKLGRWEKCQGSF